MTGPDFCRITELRVHGVSGTPPEGVIDRPLLRRVAGDGEAGFYRPRAEYGGTTGPAGTRLEGYSWGNLTSGAAARALWLLLLPFTLANVASWMRPVALTLSSPRHLRRLDAFVLGLSRLFALTLTATLVLAAAGVALDLVAWQCTAPGSSCGQTRSYLRAFMFPEPGRRLAVATVLPVAVIGLLWYLARRTWIHYERYRPGVTGAGEALADPGFWYGRHLVGRLRAIHISTAFGTLAAVLAHPVWEFDRLPGGSSWLGVAGAAVFCGALALVVVGMVLLWIPVVGKRDEPAPKMRGFLKVLRAASLAAVLVAMAYAALPRPGWESSGALPGYAGLIAGLFTGQAAILLVMAVALLPLRRAIPADADPRPAFLGFAAPVMSALALLVACALSAGVSYRIADWLNGRRVPSPSVIFSNEDLALQPPRAYEWASFGFTFAVAAVVILLVFVKFGVVPKLVRTSADLTDTDFPGMRSRSRSRAAKIDKAIGEAYLTDRIARLVTFALVPTLVLVLVIDVVVVLLDIGPVDLAPEGSRTAVMLSLLTNAGTWLIGASAFGLIILGVQAYRTPRTRKLVGIIWDLGTFWPRAAHPLAPPCYAERVVPELVTRAAWLAGPGLDEDSGRGSARGGGPGSGRSGGRGGVILSGHSQGSVLVAAAYLQLPEEVRARSALLTYGSPLRRLYTRFFPAYFGRGALQALAADMTDPAVPGRATRTGAGADGGSGAVGGLARGAGDGARESQTRWINLWRCTDPIGGEVGIPRVDRRFVDPLRFDNWDGDTVPPKLWGHSGYPEDTAFEVAVMDLAASLPRDEPTGG